MSVTIDVVIVGAGPAGLAMSACLYLKKINYIVIEKSDTIAPLWKYCTYDGLVLQRPKEKCQLPHLAFSKKSPEGSSEGSPEGFPKDSPEGSPEVSPEGFPKDSPKEYPTKEEFIEYLEKYRTEFEIDPKFNERVTSAKYDEAVDRWMVLTEKKHGDLVSTTTYICKVVVVATGRDAEPVEPKDIDGLEDFRGKKFHSRDYKNGEEYKGKTVLVIGSGDSAIDIYLDLTHHGAKPFMMVRNNLIKDFYENISSIKVSDLSKLQMNFGEFRMGDRRGEIEINMLPKIIKFNSDSVDLENDEIMTIDCVVMATGYENDVHSWLQEKTFFDERGVRNKEIECEDMVKARLCVIGFKKAGILAIYRDGPRIADCVEKS